MADPHGRGRMVELLERHRVRPSRRLGQHFLADPNLVRKVVALAGGRPGDRVLEVGAGTGTLTRALAGSGYRVLAFEVDRRLEPLLRESLQGVEGVDLRLKDALDADLGVTLEGGPWTLVANLPYNVGTPLLLDLLRRAPQVRRFVVMVQREVAERLAARPGSKAYGIPSVVAQLHGRVERAFRVPPQVFVPPPQVESEVVILERVDPPVPVAHVERAIEIAGAAFGQRRKMLRRSLAGVVTDAPAVLEAAGVPPDARPEQLAPEQFVEIAVKESDRAR